MRKEPRSKINESLMFGEIFSLFRLQKMLKLDSLLEKLVLERRLRV